MDICLNGAYAAVLSGFKIVLQRIEIKNNGSGPGERRGDIPGGAGTTPGPGPRRAFPERDDRDHGQATALAITEAFLIYATRAGTVDFFCLPEWAPLAGVDLKHVSPVKRLWPNCLGTKVAFVDAANAGWIYSPASDRLTQVRRRESDRRSCCQPPSSIPSCLLWRSSGLERIVKIMDFKHNQMTIHLEIRG